MHTNQTLPCFCGSKLATKPGNRLEWGGGDLSWWPANCVGPNYIHQIKIHGIQGWLKKPIRIVPCKINSQHRPLLRPFHHFHFSLAFIMTFWHWPVTPIFSLISLRHLPSELYNSLCKAHLSRVSLKHSTTKLKLEDLLVPVLLVHKAQA